jgi:dTDP-4-dehydrorhamnose reductase
MILITGGSGMLGKYVLDEFQRLELDFIAPSRKEFNLTSSESVINYLNQHTFKGIIHLAAETDVDLCERSVSHAYRVNTLATLEIARFAGENNIPVIYISTSSVFGGIIKLNYCELDTPMPINYYAQSKLAAEKYLSAFCPNNLIIRSSFMIGGGPQRDKKFISTLLPRLKENKPVSMVFDKIGSLTYAYDLAVFIAQAYKAKSIGLLHFSSKNSCSRYDVIQYIAQKIGSTSEISEVSSQHFPLSAERSLSEALISVSPLSPENRRWETIIDSYLKEWIT